MFNFERLLKRAAEQHRNKTFLCRAVGKADNYINGLIKNGREPRPEIVSVWAEVLDVSEDYLLGKSDSPSRTAQTKKDSTQYSLSEVLKMLNDMQSALPNLTPNQIAEMHNLWVERGYIQGQSTSEQ